MLQPQGFEVDDYSGGITDFYIGAPKDRAQILDNLFVLTNRTAKSRNGSNIDNDDDTDSLIPAGNKRIGALVNYNNSNTLFVQALDNIYYRSTVDQSYVTLEGPVDSNPVFSAGDESNYMSWTEWNRHLIVTNDAFVKPQKIYKDETDTVQVRTAGLPALASAPIVTVGAAGARNYIYAFHYFFSYTIGSQEFIDAGPVVEVEVPNSGVPETDNNEITAIPVLANGATDNYDTATIEVHIFRTLDGGQDLQFIGFVTNGTTTFTDDVSDATAETGELIYITGGVLDNDPPPLAKYVHTVNGFTYYAHFQEGSEVFPNKYRQSIQNDPDSCPGSLEDEVEDEITGFSSAAGVPMVFCKRFIYRVEGQFDEFGQGAMEHIKIADTPGCLSHQGIVQAEGRVFWPGNDGFYTSDGYQVQKISFHLKNSYLTYVDLLSNTRRIVGMFNEFERRIYWTFQTQGSSTDVDSCIVLDLEWGIKPESHFITLSGQGSFSPTSICMFNKKWMRADRRGFVFIHDEQYLHDPKIDTTKFPSLWGQETVIWRYKGPAFNFGNNTMRKWVPRVILKAANESNVSIQINGIVDDGRFVKSCKEIRWRQNFTWGDPEFTWGDPNCKWNGEGIIDQWRHFPKKGLRCDYFQLEITNAFTIVTNSDTLGTATFNDSTNHIVLDTPSVTDWPDGVEGYYISTEDDDYNLRWLVKTRIDDNTIEVLDPANTLPSGSLRWILKGYRKDEKLNLLNYTIVWAPLTMSQSTFRSEDTGANS